jgi:hypothetical protein
MQAVGHSTQLQTLVASLSGSNGATGYAALTPGTSSGQNTFVLQVSGLTASTQYTVQVGSTTIGSLTTDATGTGKVSLSNVAAAIAAGSIITVQDWQNTTVLQGTFGSGSGCQAQGSQALSATLSGSAGASGFAQYTPGTTSGQNSFALQVSGLSASAPYSIQVGSGTIGSFTTDSSGAGSLSLSNVSTAISAGSILTVLNAQNNPVLSGTFAAANGY